MRVNVNIAAFKEQLRTTVDKLHAATRPAAQSGAEIIYQRARINAPVSEDSHFFYIRGKKYGPYAPGTLRDAIYQVFSKDNSFKDVSTYHISFNKSEAPYGFIVHNGTKFRRYPESKRRNDRVYFTPGIADRQRGVRRLHEELWIEHHGPIPAGHIVVFRPGCRTTDPAAITPSRLEIVTRAENMRRNSIHTRLPPAVVDLIRLRNALRRKINNRISREQQDV